MPAKSRPTGESKFKMLNPDVPQTIPLEYAGKWVAWSPDGLRIVAIGRSFDDVERKAAQAGYPVAVIDKIPVRRRPLDGPEA